MQRFPRLTRALMRTVVGSAFVGVFLFAAPAAGAAEAPIPPVPAVGGLTQAVDNFATQVDAVASDLGISQLQADAAVTQARSAASAADAAAAQAVNDATRGTRQLVQTVSAAANGNDINDTEDTEAASPAAAATAAPVVSEQLFAEVNKIADQRYVQNQGTAAPAEPVEPLTNPNPIGLQQVQEQGQTPAEASLQEATQPEFEPINVDPNYQWRNDQFSKMAAAKPFADYVLHRVPGSYFDAPRIPEASNQAMGRGHSLYGPGTPVFVGRDSMCTLTVAGYDEAGNKVGLTAGHCGEVGDRVSSADSWQMGTTGTVVSKNPYLDYSVIQFDERAEVSRGYNGVYAHGVGGGVRPGQVTCKRGVATGTTCGVVYAHGEEVQVNQVCAMVGDSGAPLFRDGRVVGAVTGGIGGLSCRTPWQGAIHSPTTASNLDAVTADMDRRGGVGSGFRLPD